MNRIAALPLLAGLLAGCVSTPVDGPGGRTGGDGRPAEPARAVASVLVPGVVPPLQAGAKTADAKGVRLGLPCVSHHDVAGLDLALVGTSAGRDFRGVQLSGLANLVGRDADGVQAALFANKTGGAVRGVQLAAVYNAAERLEGLQFGALGYAAAVDGAQIGLVNGADSVRGVQIGLFNATRVLKGVQIGLSNYVQESGLPWFPIVNAKF